MILRTVANPYEFFITNNTSTNAYIEKAFTGNYYFTFGKYVTVDVNNYQHTIEGYISPKYSSSISQQAIGVKSFDVNIGTDDFEILALYTDTYYKYEMFQTRDCYLVISYSKAMGFYDFTMSTEENGEVYYREQYLIQPTEDKIVRNVASGCSNSLWNTIKINTTTTYYITLKDNAI